MDDIKEFINNKLAEIAKKLPTLVHTDPASFACGFNMGYKQCLLDLDRLILDDTPMLELGEI